MTQPKAVMRHHLHLASTSDLKIDLEAHKRQAQQAHRTHRLQQRRLAGFAIFIAGATASLCLAIQFATLPVPVYGFVIACAIIGLACMGFAWKISTLINPRPHRIRQPHQS